MLALFLEEKIVKNFDGWDFFFPKTLKNSDNFRVITILYCASNLYFHVWKLEYRDIFVFRYLTLTLPHIGLTDWYLLLTLW